MLKIRLQRVGRKHEPSFRLVLTDSKNSTKSGRFAELLGNYDPRKSLESIKADRIKHWLSMGAGVTGSVNNLLIKKGIIRGKKTHVGQDNVVKEAPVVETPSAEPAVEAPAEDVADPVEAAPTESDPEATEAPTETPAEPSPSQS